MLELYQSILFIQSSEPTYEDGTKIDLTPPIPSAALPLLETSISDERESAHLFTDIELFAGSFQSIRTRA